MQPGRQRLRGGSVASEQSRPGLWLPPPGSREMWGAWCRIRGSSSPCSLAGEQIKRLSHHPHRQHSNSSCESPVCPRRCPLISKLALLTPAGRGLSHPCAPSTHRFHIPVTPATVSLALRCLSTCRCICAESGTVRARPGPVDLGSHWHLAGCPALGSARSSLNVDFRKGQPNICCFGMLLSLHLGHLENSKGSRELSPVPLSV
ncbi:uncharacterized protein LOC108582839 [Papio anubis]|uniref:uncharacterized protein LOC108582839 n=1 Tax=Papio anubis TaxID=9555 RepID=UPI0012AE6CE1|nr:uncharacterized protein LOC108582839 [Papio anubis]